MKDALPSGPPLGRLPVPRPRRRAQVMFARGGMSLFLAVWLTFVVGPGPRTGGVAELLAPGAAAQAAWTPSADLSFRVTASPDSITVGDPITLEFVASGPEESSLELPALGDSIGAFTVLSAGDLIPRHSGGRLHLSREAKVTLFHARTETMPPLPLLWVRAGGETLVAWSSPQEVRVGHLLTGQADIQTLKGLKGVVSLSRFPWLLVSLVTAAAAALAFLLWRYRHKLRRRRTSDVGKTAAPPLPPEVAFERGLQTLLRRGLPEKGEPKLYYFEISHLLRRYLEEQFGFPAVEETRSEVLSAIGQVSTVTPARRASLAVWLEEGDLVKFARQEAYLSDAQAHTEQARRWVSETAREVEAQRRAVMGVGLAGSPAAGALPGQPEGASGPSPGVSVAPAGAPPAEAPEESARTSAEGRP